MTPADKEAFVKIVLGFAEIKGRKLSLPAVELYWGAMQKWSIEDFRAAAEQLLTTSEYFPTPKEFEDLRKAGRESAAEIFASLDQWFEYSPEGYTVRADTPRLIACAIRSMGGADAYMLGDVSKRPFLERRFCEHYDTITEADDTREALPQIAHGFMDAQLSYANQVKVAGTFSGVGRKR